MYRSAIVFALVMLIAAGAQADIVRVEARGQVVFNSIPTAPLGNVAAGEQVLMSFTVDSNTFVEGIPGDTRGYEIDQPSFSLEFSGGMSMGLINPFPAGQTPYFTLVEGFPVSDGFFVATSPISPGGVPLAQDPYQFDLDLGYDGSTLGSLDILDALGTYNFTGLTRFAFGIWRVFPENVVLGIDYAELTIAAEPLAVDQSSWGSVKALFK